jgi:hypothetical protein
MSKTDNSGGPLRCPAPKTRNGMKIPIDQSFAKGLKYVETWYFDS